MLILYGLVASGLPLPVASPQATGSTTAKTLAGKDRSRPFPCMEKACGCDSAERCFTNCCCHTPAETLAWAKDRGIEPAVIDALARRVAVSTPDRSRLASSVAAAGSRCAAKQAAVSRLETNDPSADEAICSDYRSLAAEPAEYPLPADDEPANDLPVAGSVSLRAMLACGGIVAQWAAAGVSLPPPACVTCEFPWPPIGVVTVIDERVFGMGSPPDTPPPRA
jgi:hypothetical protein